MASVTLEVNPDGKLVLPLHLLSKISFKTAQGFNTVIRSNGVHTFVGLTEELPTLEPLGPLEHLSYIAKKKDEVVTYISDLEPFPGFNTKRQFRLLENLTFWRRELQKVDDPLTSTLLSYTRDIYASSRNDSIPEKVPEYFNNRLREPPPKVLKIPLEENFTCPDMEKGYLLKKELEDHLDIWFPAFGPSLAAATFPDCEKVFFDGDIKRKSRRIGTTAIKLPGQTDDFYNRLKHFRHGVRPLGTPGKVPEGLIQTIIWAGSKKDCSGLSATCKGEEAKRFSSSRG